MEIKNIFLNNQWVEEEIQGKIENNMRQTKMKTKHPKLII